MIIAVVALSVLGFVMVVSGAVLTYRDRTRESPAGSGLYTIPSSGPGNLVLTLIGAGAGLLAGLLSLAL